MPQNYRHTKMIFTIGPATDDEKILEKLIEEGVNICRFNMAHISHDGIKESIKRIQRASKKVGRSIALLMDVKGPEIRTGDLENPLDLQEGDLLDFVLSGDVVKTDGIPQISINYPKLITDLKIGDEVLVDSGLIRLEVIEKQTSYIRSKVIIPGKLGNRRHINLPGVHVDLPCLTSKDKNDILFGIQQGFDFFALSFVREAADVELLRNFLLDNHSRARIISKIEDQTAIRNLEAIVKASDGLMIARGDLGIECPFEELPMIQKRAIKLCTANLKPAIVATQMLESMISAPIPTRAEVTDVSNAVLERADCVMLSGETTIGKYPVECVKAMNRIVRRAEEAIESKPADTVVLDTPAEKMLRSAANLAHEIENSGIVVFTRSLRYPLLLSALRSSKIPIYTFTDDEELYRQMQLVWGIAPFFMTYTQDREESMQNAMQLLKTKGWVKSGDRVVVITNVLARTKVVESIQLRRLE